MKLFLLSFFGITFLYSQSLVEKFDYERKNQLVTSYSFKMETCPKQVLSQTWKSMVETNGGKSSMINQVFDNYSASDVVFASLSGQGSLNLYFQVFSYKSDSIIVTNAFQKLDGQYIVPNQSNDASRNAKEIMLDFSFETRKSCVNYELSQAMKYAEDLHRKIFVLENQNVYLDKNIISSHKKIQKLDSSVKSLSDQISFYKKNISTTSDDFTKTKLEEQEILASDKKIKLKERLDAENASIEEYRLKKEANLDNIKSLKAEIQNQMLVVKDLQKSLQEVKR